MIGPPRTYSRPPGLTPVRTGVSVGDPSSLKDHGPDAAGATSSSHWDEGGRFGQRSVAVQPPPGLGQLQVTLRLLASAR